MIAYNHEPKQKLEWDEALAPIAMCVRSAVARAIEASPY